MHNTERNSDLNDDMFLIKNHSGIIQKELCTTMFIAALYNSQDMEAT